MAQAGNCAGADAFLAGDLARLTKNGASSQGYFRMAMVAKNCGYPQFATTLLQKATRVRRFADTLWAYKALQSLGSPDAPGALEKMQQSLTGAGDLTDPNLYGSYQWYGIGLLQSALHQREQAAHSFENALMLPDEWMAHHLARVALEELMSEPAQVLRWPWVEAWVPNPDTPQAKAR
jgi:hypothetical protein